MKDAILALMMSVYVNQLLKNMAFGHHVIHLTMDEIQNLNKLTLKFNYRGCLSYESALDSDNLFRLEIFLNRVFNFKLVIYQRHMYFYSCLSLRDK